jgi:hypothetical protein
LTRVLFIPGLKQNLLSAQRVTSAGFSINLKDDSALIQKGSTQITLVKSPSGLYLLSSDLHPETRNKDIFDAYFSSQTNSKINSKQIAMELMH